MKLAELKQASEQYWDSLREQGCDNYLETNPDWHKFINLVSEKTGERMVDKWIENARRNKGLIRKWGPPTSLLDRGRSQAAIVVGAGPSLKKNIKALTEVAGPIKKDRLFTVIACSSCLRYCLDNGVWPDYVVAVDGSAGIAKYFKPIKKEEAERLTLISNCFTAPEALALWDGPMFFLPIGIADKRVDKEYREIHGMTELFKEGEFPATGCQFNFGVLFAYFILGCRAEIFMGADLSFGNQYYADKPDHKDTLEKINAINIFGEEVQTTTTLYQLKLGLEHWTGKMPRCAWINATEGGILGVSIRTGYLPWIKQMTLKESIDQVRWAAAEAERVNKTNEVLNQ